MNSTHAITRRDFVRVATPLVVASTLGGSAFAQEKSPGPTAANHLPTPWKFVNDEWGFGRVRFGPQADSAGRSLDALLFSLDGAAVGRQYAGARKSGKNLATEGKAGRIYDGTHAVLVGGKFGDGTLEADLCGAGRDDYQGIFFRASDDALSSRKYDGEFIYFRPFYANNDQPHYPAIQYFATQRDGADRRMFAGQEVDPKIPKSEWFHVRIEVRGVEAKVFLNDATEPALVVPRLASGRTEGLVGLWAWNGRIANLKITPASK